MTGAGDAAELGRGAAGVQLPGRLPQGRGARQHQHQGGADLHAEYVTPKYNPHSFIVLFAESFRTLRTLRILNYLVTHFNQIIPILTS